MTSASNAKVKAGVLAIAFIVLCGNSVSPLLAGMAQSYPEAGTGGVQMVMVISMLVALVLTLATGFLTRFLPMKVLTLVGLGSLTVGGLMPLALNGSITEIYISAALMGVGQGICIPMVQTFIARFFEGGEKSQMFGLQTTFKNLGGMVFLLAAGALASTTILNADKPWVNAYLVYLIFVPVILIALVGLPMGEPVKAQESGAKGGGVALPALGAIVLVALFVAGYSAMGMNLSMQVEAGGLAATGAGAGVSSIAMAIATALGAVAGICFKSLLGALKNFLFGVSAFIVAAGMALIYLSPAVGTVFVVYAGTLLVGFGYGLALSAVADAIARVSKPQQIPLSMSFYGMAATIGGALSPTIMNSLNPMLFGAGANAVTIFAVAASFMVIVAILSLVWGVSVKGYFAAKGE